MRSTLRLPLDDPPALVPGVLDRMRATLPLLLARPSGLRPGSAECKCIQPSFARLHDPHALLLGRLNANAWSPPIHSCTTQALFLGELIENAINSPIHSCRSISLLYWGR